MVAMRMLALLFPTVALFAQEQGGPLRFVPEDATFVARSVGPAVWQREFGEVSLIRALASPELQPKWSALAASLEHELGFADDSQRARLASLWEHLRGYGGDIVLAGRIDWEDMAADMEAFPGALMLAIAGDGHVDLQRLADDVRELLPDVAGEEVEIGGMPTSIWSGEGIDLAGPIVMDETMILFCGSDLEKQAPLFLQADGRSASVDHVRDAAFGLHMRLQWSSRQLRAIFDVLGIAPEAAAVLEVCGILSVAGFGMTISPDGRYVGQTMDIEFGAGPRGLFDVMMPERRGRPGLLRYLPQGASAFLAMPLGGSAIERLYASFFDAQPAGSDFDRELLEQQFTALTKIDLIEDVLAQIGDEYLRIDDAAAAPLLDEEEDFDEDLDRAHTMFGNTCFVVRVRDGRSFAKSLDTAIRARGMHVGRKREDYLGHRVYRLNLLGMLPVEYAVTDTLFVIGIGESEATRQNLRGVLDAVEAESSGAQALPLSAEVLERLRGLPEGWGGIEVTSVIDMLDGITTGFGQLEAMLAVDGLVRDDVDSPIWLYGDLAGVVRPALAREGVGIAVQTVYLTGDRYSSRSRW